MFHQFLTQGMPRRHAYLTACWWAGLLLLGVPLIVRFLVLLAASPGTLSQVVDFIYDDGYYYLCIAANIATTGRSTLDGITLTNGYQPLWLLLLTGLAKLVGTSTWIYFLACCALIFTIAVCVPLSVLLIRSKSARLNALGLAAAGSIVVIQFPYVFLKGLEPILFAPLWLPFVMLLERSSRWRDWVLLSALLSIAFLIRLDALALYPACWLVLVFGPSPAASPPSRPLFKRAITIGAALALVLAPTVLSYAAVNLWLFDTPVPVSGLAKMIGGPKFSNWGVIITMVKYWRSLTLLLAVTLTLEAISRSKIKPDRLYFRSLTVIALALLMQCLYYCALSTWYPWDWYSYLLCSIVAVLVARVFHLVSLLLEARRAGIACLAATLIVAAWGCYSALSFVHSSITPQVRMLQPWINHFAPADPKDAAHETYNQVNISMLNDFFKSTGRRTVVAMGDRAGGLAYWGRERISLLQTEGLTLDINFVRARQLDEGSAYLETHYAIDYLMIDREVLPRVVDSEGHSQYVVAEPIQGRVTFGALSVFCFPDEAVRYKRTYTTGYTSDLRIAFAFSLRTPCSSAANTLIHDAALGIGLHQLSLPSEYLPGASGLRKPLEDADRRRARKLWMNQDRARTEAGLKPKAPPRAGSIDQKPDG